MTRSENGKLTRLETYTDFSTENIREILNKLLAKASCRSRLTHTEQMLIGWQSPLCLGQHQRILAHEPSRICTTTGERRGCWLRIMHTPLYRKIIDARQWCGQEDRSNERTNTRSPSRLPITGGLHGEPGNETSSGFSSIGALLYNSLIEEKSDFNLPRTHDSSAPLEELAKVLGALGS